VSGSARCRLFSVRLGRRTDKGQTVGGCRWADSTSGGVCPVTIRSPNRPNTQPTRRPTPDQLPQLLATNDPNCPRSLGCCANRQREPLGCCPELDRSKAGRTASGLRRCWRSWLAEPSDRPTFGMCRMGETPALFVLPFPYRFNQPTRTDRKRLKVKLIATDEKIKIKWFVWSGDVKMPHESSMRGTWGWDATCSCGWETRTGGAVRSSVLQDVQKHKRFDHNYAYDFSYDYTKEAK